MDKPDAEPAAPAPEIPEGLTIVGEFDNNRTASEHGLAILAMGEPYWLYKHESTYQLCVETKHAQAAKDELERFRHAQRPWHHPLTQLPPAQGYGLATASSTLLLIALYSLQTRPDTPDLTELGNSDAHLIIGNGEIHRALTATTLHADIGHLASNLIAMGCFMLPVTRQFGYGLGWLLALIAGTAANLITASLYWPDSHRSIGLSGVVFGAFGLLVGQALSQRMRPSDTLPQLKNFAAPLLAGLTILSLYGAGGPQTDLLAHLFGFACGVALGAVIEFTPLTQPPNPTHQRLQPTLGILSLMLITAAWYLALT